MNRADNQPTYGPGIECIKRPDLERFFMGVGQRMEAAEVEQRRRNKKEATGFNVFDYIDPYENDLSDVLRDLLDPKGDHGQGELFLKLLCEKLGYVGASLGLANAKVQTEAPTHGIEKYRRRMDVFVDAGVLVAIENKVDATEQKDQVKAYLEHLRVCTKGNGKRSVLIYLTPNGRRPKSIDRAEFEEARLEGKLCCWSYRDDLWEWLESCRKQCAARKIQDFLGDFIVYIQTKMQREPENREDDFEGE